MNTRRLFASALTAFTVATALAGCAGNDGNSSEGEATGSSSPTTTATAAPSSPPPSASFDVAGRQVCDTMKEIEARGYQSNPQELADAGETGMQSTNPDIRDESTLLSAFASAASVSIQTGGDPAQHMSQLGQMVLDLSAACRAAGYM
ncbi:hypothetical protein [Saccharopolyspora sp. 5N708]|uniref:hypothetical protein n=1 Tax=Saccharopolyspora sp. 5N708 TaxID=3457424 RepID=UPI003FD38549